MTPGDWRQEFSGREDNDVQSDNQFNNTSAIDGRMIRDILKDYFFEEGSVPFQWRMTE